MAGQPGGREDETQLGRETRQPHRVPIRRKPSLHRVLFLMGYGLA